MMQSTSPYSQHASRRRAGRSATRSAWWVHLVGAIALVVGLFLPLTSFGQAVAAPNGAASTLSRLQSADDTVPAAPVQVGAMGDFQQALGCNAFDPYCQTSQLANNNGIWSGVFAVPPGTYSWQIAAVAQDGTVSTYGQGGLGGNQQQVTVGDSDAGLYFQLNTHTNEVEASPVSGLLTVQVDGTTYALEPADGNFSVVVVSQGGAAGWQVFADGAPLTDPQQVQLNPGPNRLTFSADGQLMNAEPLTAGSVTIQRLDADGAPLAGGCYQLRSGDDLVNQACDSDDGAPDGSTLMTFPQGVTPGNVTVVEVTAPDGAEAVADQDLALQGGDMVVTLQPEGAGDEGGEVIEGGDEPQTPDTGQGPGDLIVNLVDANGQPVGGACFQLLQDGNVVAEACDTTEFDPPDFANNGATGFFDTPGGSYTLHLSQAPNGGTADDQDVEVVTGTQTDVTVTLAAANQPEQPTNTPEIPPTETPQALPTNTPEAATGNLTVTLRDQNGDGVGGACFMLLQDGIPVSQSCDTTDWESAEFANNGNTGFFNVPAGDYTLTLSSAPQGVTVEDRDVTINPGGDDTVVIDVTVAEAPTATSEAATATATATAESTQESEQRGNLIVTLQDAEGQPVGGACWELRQNGAAVAASCDTPQFDQNPNNGNTGFYGVPTGTYVLHNAQNPGDQSLAEDREVEIVSAPPDGTVTVQLDAEEAPAETPTSAPTATATATEQQVNIASESQPGPPGDLIVTLEDDNGQPIGGACFQIAMEGQAPIQSCDSDDPFPGNGNTGFFGVPSGTYTLTQSQVPAGSAAIEPKDITVEAGEESTEIVNPAPTGGQDDGPVIEQGEDGQTVGGIDQGDQAGGSIVVDVSQLEGQDICIQLNTGGGISLVNPPSACDNGDGDENDDDGLIELVNVPAGSYILSVTSGADDVEPQDVTIEDGETLQVELAPAVVTPPTETPTPAPTTGTLTINVTDSQGTPLGGACFDVENDSGTFSFCDEDGNGVIPIPDVVFGTQQIEQTEAPVGYTAADVDNVDVSLENQDVAITVVNEQALGTVEITSENADGDALSGFCVSVAGGDEQCDNGSGTIELQLPVTGVEQAVVQTSAPDGYQPAADQTVLVEQDDTVEVVFTNAPATGTIRVISVDSGLNPLPAACAELDGDDETCDDDGNGVITFENVPVGSHSVSQVTPPDGYQEVDDKNADVQAGQQVDVLFTNAPETGTIRVVSTDGDQRALPGACVALDGGNPVCDEDGDGVINFDGVAIGDHTLSQTTAPDGYQQAADQTAEVEQGEQADVVFSSEQATGTIRVVSADGDQNALPGACVALDDGEPLCDADEDGVLNFEDVPVGDHTLSQTTPPDGYQAAGDQTATVAAGEQADVLFTNAPDTGSILVTVQNDDGERVSNGVCVAYQAENGEPVTTCEAIDDGQFRFTGVAPGTYAVFASTVPEDYTSPETPASVDVTAGQEATAEITLPDISTVQGSALLNFQSEDGAAVGGLCFQLLPEGDGEALGPFCDNDDNDQDATEGVVLLQGLPTGTWGIQLQDQEIQVARASQSIGSVIIQAGQTADQVIVVPGLFLKGSIQITTEDSDSGQDLGGACYHIDTATPIDVCDGGDLDRAPETGRILVNNIVAGTYTVSLTTSPDGYSGAPDQDATVEGGVTTPLTFAVDVEITTGSVEVHKVDDAGDPLAGTCFRLQHSAGVVAEACDGDDGDSDGTVTLADVPAGRYQLVETRTPGGEYQPAPMRVVQVTAGETLTVEVENSLAPGRLYVIKVDNDDTSVRLEDACFALQGDSNYGPFCDGDDLSVDGRIVFNNVRPGDYTLVETQSPAGYDPAPDRGVTIQPAVTLQVTVENSKTPPPPEAGTLVVNKLDQNKDPLAGGCFRLFDGDSPVTGQVCDITDGTNDSQIVFEDVAVGTWTLRETLAPSPSYQIAPDQQVTIFDDQTTEVDVVNQLKRGRVLVKKVTEQGEPIADACFDLAGDGQGQQCSNTAGELLFENVPVGTYTLNETQAPYGFKPAEPVEGIKVNPGQTTVVTVENERQPPPNTGSVQVLKFVCPVNSADDERTIFLGGAAGDAQLSQTAGCTPANAEFTLVGQDGADGPGAFATGDDGQYQVTVPAKIYRLDETNPDLPGNSAALLRVEVGRLTTVVVINYVAPPAPEPVDITVSKYTCQAGFNGTTFEDFAASCMDDSQLTNGITIRAEGPVDLKAVTGDGGQTGRTAFADQPSGTYAIYEERPYNIPTNYGFCGWDSNWPADYKTVNGTITAELGEGAHLTCVFFNIPEETTQTTGVILVRKFTCDVNEPPKGYEWNDECRLSDANAQFELKQYDEATDSYGEGTTVTANPDGFVRYPLLEPGSYQLREVGSNWCHAESNSVNSKGDVVVTAGVVSQVWIYNCVGTEVPPNTGSGDAAGLLNPDTPDSATPAGVGVTPGVAWPGIILGLVAALWPRKVLAPAVVRNQIHRRDAA